MGAAANVHVGAAILRERLSRGVRTRVAEPMVMEGAGGVDAFDVAHPVLQMPTYQISAEAMSRLLPEGGRVLDLGSGSGQLVAHLARARPDVSIVGTDLSERMLETGRAMLRDHGLADRVELRRLDMTRADEAGVEDVDLVSTVWALHHLPAREHLVACLRAMATLRERSGCAVWIFDFARLHRADTFPVFFRLAPDAPAQLRIDGIASERAAWSHQELSDALADAGLGDLRGGRERVIGHYQCRWAHRRDEQPAAHDRLWRPAPLPQATQALVGRLRRTLPLP